MTTVPSQPYRPQSSAAFEARPSAFESFLIHSGRALINAGEDRARRNAARLTHRPSAAAGLLLAHEAFRTDVQAAAHSGIRAH